MVMERKSMFNPSKVVKQCVNLGSLPYFSAFDEKGKRKVMFHADQIIDRFPRVLSLTRILDTLEINLFLEHRYKGVFMPPKRGGEEKPARWSIACYYEFVGKFDVIIFTMD